MGANTDLRIQKTYLALHNAFTELLEESTFEHLTVNELCGRAMIRRATFYKHFADKYEYFSHYTKETAEAFREQYNTDTPQNDIGNYLDHMCQQLLLFMKQHKRLVLNIKKSSVFPLLLSILVEQTHYDVIDALNRSDIGKTLSKNQREAIASFFAGGISNTLFRCLTADGTVDEEKFTSLLNIIREPKHFFA